LQRFELKEEERHSCSEENSQDEYRPKIVEL